MPANVNGEPKPTVAPEAEKDRPSSAIVAVKVACPVALHAGRPGACVNVPVQIVSSGETVPP